MRSSPVALALALFAASLAWLVTATSPPAAAYSTCGDGYHKDSASELMFDDDAVSADGRSIVAKVGGTLTFCNRERSASLDQYNQRVVVGMPTDIYATAKFAGSGVTKMCLHHKILVYTENVSTGSSVGISTDTIGWTTSWADKIKTIKIDPICSGTQSYLRSLKSDFKVTVPNAGWAAPEPKITKVVMKSTATMRYKDGSSLTQIDAAASVTSIGRTIRDVDVESPVLDKPVASLSNPYSRTANYSINATDDSGTVSEMRVKATGDADWRPWVAYAPSGTVILPDRYGDFTVWFQVRDAAGNMSSQRASDVITRLRDTTGPTLAKPVASLQNPTSRTATYSIDARDDSGTVSEMRVRATGDPDWRPWVAYVPNGTVILPDRYGEFTIWFQVRDASGNLSLERAADNVTRVQDTSGPTITSASISKADETSRYVQYSLGASDDYSGVAQMRVLVSGEDWRPWVAYSPSGTVVLPDGWGRFGITFQVMDGAGNVSGTQFAGAATRTATVTPTLRQIDNNGNVRSCGSTPEAPCSDVVKKFRTTISSALLPDTSVLLKAWRYVNGSWVETSSSPFMSEPINGRWTIDMTVTANLLSGVWRFQAQVPRDPEDATSFGASDYQYLRIS